MSQAQGTLWSSTISVEGWSVPSMKWTTVSDGNTCLSRSWRRILFSCSWQLSSGTSTRLSCWDRTLRSSACEWIAESRRLSSSSSPCRLNGSWHHGSVCWICILTTMPMLICFKQTLANAIFSAEMIGVLPQVALWGKGMLWLKRFRWPSWGPMRTSAKSLGGMNS